MRWPRSGCSSSTAAPTCDFLKRVFHKLLLNFTWWLNRQDPDGNNLFGGGFLGLDNISPIDRSHLPPGFKLDQADGTAWMAYYSVAMLTLATTLAEHDDVYEDMVVKFLEQTVLIMDALEDSGCYDTEDGFFYDRLTDPSGNSVPIKVQTLVGVIPALPAVALPTRDTDRIRRLRKRFARRLEQTDRHEILDWQVRGAGESRRTAAVGRPDGQTRPDLRHLVRRGGIPVSRMACDRSPSATTRPTRFPGCPTRPSSTNPPNPAPPCTAAIPTGEDRCGSRSTT